MNKVYKLKHLKPTLELDEELNPGNIVKPGKTANAVCNRQFDWTKRLGVPMNVMAVFSNPKTGYSLLEDMLHDFYAAWRRRKPCRLGKIPRETADDVPLGYQAMGVCFAAEATKREIDPADFKKFAPRQSAINWVMKQITKQDHAVLEGLGYMRFGKLYGASADGNLEWVDGSFFKDERAQNEMDLGSVVAHDLVMEFSPTKQPVEMEFCEYKSPKIIVSV
jgi:hypothetical protein